MSWDILIINSDKPVDFEKGDWTDFSSRQSVRDKIQQTFPDSNWDDPSWGLLRNDQVVIEFNIGESEEPGNHFMLHVRGGQDPTGEIARLCHQHGWVAFDISAGQYIDNNKPDAESFKNWESYRDQVVLGTTNKKPWWKFW